MVASRLEGISAANANSELTANVAETHTGAENDTGDPGADRDALL